MNRPRIPANPLALDGKRIFLVEDDDRLYCLLKNALHDLGCEVFGSSAHLPGFWGSAPAAHVDAAVIDNSETAPAAVLIRQLEKSGVPILLIGTSDSCPGSQPRYARLTKPFTEEDLVYGIVEALGARHTDSRTPEPAMSQVAL